MSANVPELRFSGFADPWEQRKLGDITRRVTRKNENLESQLPLTISAQYGLVDQTEFFNNRVASSDLSGYYLLHKGEFAYNKSKNLSQKTKTKQNNKTTAITIIIDRIVII